jgi:hypothetical protein
MDDNELEAQRLHDQRRGVRRQVRDETIDEMCDWLGSCIEGVDHDSEVYKACAAMVKAMRGKKTQPSPNVPFKR